MTDELRYCVLHSSHSNRACEYCGYPLTRLSATILRVTVAFIITVQKLEQTLLVQAGLSQGILSHFPFGYSRWLFYCNYDRLR